MQIQNINMEYINMFCEGVSILIPSESFSPLSGGSVKPVQIQSYSEKCKSSRISTVLFLAAVHLPNKAIDAIRTQGTIKLKK